jgi:hypothetical protein
MALMLVLYMPWILKSAILTRFWSTPFGKSGYFLVVDITSLILWDEDHGFFGTRLLGLAAVSLLYFVLNNIFEYLGVPLIQEKAGRR